MINCRDCTWSSNTFPWRLDGQWVCCNPKTRKRNGSLKKIGNIYTGRCDDAEGNRKDVTEEIE